MIISIEDVILMISGKYCYAGRKYQSKKYNFTKWYMNQRRRHPQKNLCNRFGCLHVEEE